MHSNTELPKSSLLMKTIGIPGVSEPDLSLFTKETMPDFLKCAKKNKVSLFFLKSIASKLDSDPAESMLHQYEEQYQKTVELTKFVASLLEQNGVMYTFFKTLKPFPYVPSDVDVLLFSDSDLKKVVSLFSRQGCKVLDGDSYGVTMYSPVHNLNIDITMQIAVSGLVYVDKMLLVDCINSIDFDGIQIRTLDPPADLLVVVAHSIFKEQMFTLSDYYFLVMNSKTWKEALKLAKKIHLTSALHTMLKIAGALTLDSFDIPNPLIHKLDSLGFSQVAGSHEPFELPFKYNFVTITNEFAKKLLADPAMLNSLPVAIRSLFNSDFYLKAIQHLTRTNY